MIGPIGRSGRLKRGPRLGELELVEEDGERRHLLERLSPVSSSSTALRVVDDLERQAGQLDPQQRRLGAGRHRRSEQGLARPGCRSAGDPTAERCPALVEIGLVSAQA